MRFFTFYSVNNKNKMENPESILLDLEEFNRNNEEDKQIPQILENFIEYVAKTGTYIFPWNKIRKLYLTKLKCVLNSLSPMINQPHLNITNDTSFNNSSSNLNTYLNTTHIDSNNNIQVIKDRITERMRSFTSAPFTIQRISELLLKPNNHYSRTDKFLRGLEKCVMVVTTIDSNGNKIFIDNVFDSPSPSPSPSPDRLNEIAFAASMITPVRPATPEPLREQRATIEIPSQMSPPQLPPPPLPHQPSKDESNQSNNEDESMVLSTSTDNLNE